MADAEKSVAIAASVLGEVLAHPLRIQILEQLIRGPGSAKSISDALDFSLSNVSYHLREVLFEKCQVIVEYKWVKRRGARETFFRLDYKRLLTLIRDAAPFSAQLLAGLAAGDDNDASPGHAKSGNGLAWLRLGSVGAANWDDVSASLADAEGRIALELGGRNGDHDVQAIFAVAALRLPEPPGTP